MFASWAGLQHGMQILCLQALKGHEGGLLLGSRCNITWDANLHCF